MSTITNRRVLLIDDMPAIHEDFRKILSPGPSTVSLDEFESALFGEEATAAAIGFELDSAYQGQEGVAKIEAAVRAGKPYALAFVDMRMPPGWDGVETIERIWKIDPRIQIVICTAYSDYSWEEVLERLDVRDRLLILKKPFDSIEVSQLASTLTGKWAMTEQAALKLSSLESAVEARTAELRTLNEALQQDIVQRSKTEAELRLAASVFHNTTNGIMITDASTKILSINPAFTAITGYSIEDTEGKDSSLLGSDFHEAAFYDGQRETLLREGRWEGEIWNRRKNGDVFLAALSVGVVADVEGQPVRYVSVFTDITDIRSKDEGIRYLAFHDALTGLPNRALLLDRLEHRITFSRRDDTRLVVMFIDLDRFKQINDSLGHDVGDGLLKEVSGRLTNCVRQSDTVARMGGDEFVILLEHVDEPEGYAGLAKRIIASLSMPVVLGGHSLQVGASIGIACFPEDGGDAIELMKHADAAMYAAKSAGRGTYRFFQAIMTEKVGRRLQLEMALRSAIPNGELELFYQPKVWLATQALHSMEALIRWHHPTAGLISPAEFIPMAEETGIIAELGDWVIEDACRQSRAWQDQGFGRIKIAVNISAKQLQQHDLVERITSLTEKYRILPADLEIELTESVIMANPDEISRLFARLREIGVTIAVDDFGTGYSSLAYLRRLPIDVLKIDRSFVMSADCNDGDAQIVKIIVSLGQALKLVVIAEGVETESQAQLLKSCGCAIAQGYLYSRPQPVAQIEAWLRERELKNEIVLP